MVRVHARPDTRRFLPAALVGGIVLFALAIRLWMFVGISRLDMFRYLELSHHVLQGGSLFDKGVFYASSRLTLIAPLLLSNKLFGYGEHVSVIWPLLCSLGSVVVAYLLAKELWGELAGVLAAFGMAVAPLEVQLATQLLPDAIEGFFVVLAVLLAVLAIKRDRHYIAYAVGSGAAIGLAYFTRVNAIVFLPGLLLLGALLEPKKWRRSLWALAGLAGVLVAAAGVFWVLSGDPLVDWHRTGQFYQTYTKVGFRPTVLTFRQMIVTIPSLVWMVPAFLIGLALFAIRRGREELVMLIWAVGFFVYADFIGPLHGLDRAPSTFRYLEPMTLPLVALVAAAAAIASQRSRDAVQRALPIVATVLVGLALLHPAAHAVRSTRYSMRWAAVRRAAISAAYKADVVVVLQDDDSLEAFNYFSGYVLRRDACAPVNAVVNKGARLFALKEADLAPGSLFVATSTPDPFGHTGRLLAKYKPYPEGALKMYEILR